MTNRNVLIIGATEGGADAVTKQIAKNGRDDIVLIGPNKEKLEKLVQDLPNGRNNNGRYEFHCLDLLDLDTMKSEIAQHSICDRHYDVVIVNAWADVRDVGASDPGVLDPVFRANVLGPMLLVRGALAHRVAGRPQQFLFLATCPVGNVQPGAELAFPSLAADFAQFYTLRNPPTQQYFNARLGLIALAHHVHLQKSSGLVMNLVAPPTAAPRAPAPRSSSPWWKSFFCSEKKADPSDKPVPPTERVMEELKKVRPYGRSWSDAGGKGVAHGMSDEQVAAFVGYLNSLLDPVGPAPGPAPEEVSAAASDQAPPPPAGGPSAEPDATAAADTSPYKIAAERESPTLNGSAAEAAAAASAITSKYSYLESDGVAPLNGSLPPTPRSSHSNLAAAAVHTPSPNSAAAAADTPSPTSTAAAAAAATGTPSPKAAARPKASSLAPVPTSSSNLAASRTPTPKKAAAKTPSPNNAATLEASSLASVPSSSSKLTTSRTPIAKKGKKAAGKTPSPNHAAPTP